jgi:hypothetical protein
MGLPRFVLAHRPWRLDWRRCCAEAGPQGYGSFFAKGHGRCTVVRTVNGGWSPTRRSETTINLNDDHPSNHSSITLHPTAVLDDLDSFVDATWPGIARRICALVAHVHTTAAAPHPMDSQSLSYPIGPNLFHVRIFL